MNESKFVIGLPRWVVMSWHMAAIVTALFLVLLAGINYRTWREMRAMNDFWIRIEQRQDSINAAARARRESIRADSIRRDSLLRR